MAHPAEQSARADPEPGRDDEPKDSPPEVAIIDLAHAGHHQRQNGRSPWSTHSPSVSRICIAASSQRGRRARARGRGPNPVPGKTGPVPGKVRCREKRTRTLSRLDAQPEGSHAWTPIQEKPRDPAKRGREGVLPLPSPGWGNRSPGFERNRPWLCTMTPGPGRIQVERSEIRGVRGPWTAGQGLLRIHVSIPRTMSSEPPVTSARMLDQTRTDRDFSS